MSDASKEDMLGAMARAMITLVNGAYRAEAESIAQDRDDIKRLREVFPDMAPLYFSRLSVFTKGDRADGLPFIEDLGPWVKGAARHLGLNEDYYTAVIDDLTELLKDEYVTWKPVPSIKGVGSRAGTGQRSRVLVDFVDKHCGNEFVTCRKPSTLVGGAFDRWTRTETASLVITMVLIGMFFMIYSVDSYAVRSYSTPSGTARVGVQAVDTLVTRMRWALSDRVPVGLQPFVSPLTRPLNWIANWQVQDWVDTSGKHLEQIPRDENEQLDIVYPYILYGYVGTVAAVSAIFAMLTMCRLCRLPTGAPFIGAECSMCSKDASAVCSRCDTALYCSEACQKAGWADGHSKTCQ